MNGTLKNRARSFLLDIGNIYLRRLRSIAANEASQRNVAHLIKRLRPYRTQFELIRIGPDGDGGYLLPDDLGNIKACFSPGVYTVSEFELECLEMYNMKVFMADRSVDKPNLNISEDRYSFQKKFIGCTNNEEFMTMDEWVNSTPVEINSDLLLQMDIEGAEYEALINMSDSLVRRFRIMVIEFHDLQALWEQNFFRIAETVFSKILQTHVCVHIHPNNWDPVFSRHGIKIPNLTEFPFIRRDSVELKGFQTSFPHRLDFDNTGKKHFPLPQSWYSDKP
ncbi:FkbM family methyltransferase [Ravibacter arvi]|uniref:FkbM family methyltransferase n=1 Tax=Ravibacter arvi TaxID=2051041 RepID=A0ABP8LRQ5_9BACT